MRKPEEVPVWQELVVMALNKTGIWRGGEAAPSDEIAITWKLVPTAAAMIDPAVGGLVTFQGGTAMLADAPDELARNETSITVGPAATAVSKAIGCVVAKVIGELPGP